MHPIWRQARLAWQIAAERLGGRFEPLSTHDLGEIGGTITLSLDAVDLIVSHGERYEYTQIVAPAPDSLGLTFTIWPRFEEPPHVERRNRIVELDDEPMGSLFNISANRPALVESWLYEDVQQRLSRTINYGFTLRNEVLTARRSSLETDPSELVDAVRASAALASSGTRTYLPRWRELAEKLGGELMIEGDRWYPGDQNLVVWSVEGKMISLMVSSQRLLGQRSRLSLCTQVRAKLEAPTLERFLMSADAEDSHLEPIDADDLGLSEQYRLLSTAPQSTTMRFQNHLCREICEVNPKYIEMDGEVLSLGFKGFEMRPERLARAGELAVQLTLPIPRTVYR